jgi:hypothetical protein
VAAALGIGTRLCKLSGANLSRFAVGSCKEPTRLLCTTSPSRTQLEECGENRCVNQQASLSTHLGYLDGHSAPWQSERTKRLLSRANSFNPCQNNGRRNGDMHSARASDNQRIYRRKQDISLCGGVKEAFGGAKGNTIGAAKSLSVRRI